MVSDIADAGMDMVNLVKLDPWVAEHVPQLGAGPLTVKLLTGGSSNAVFRISRGNKVAILRRPPRVLRPDSEKVLAREARVLTALNDTAVPAPRLIATCEDRAVIGAGFYVMSNVDGWEALGDNFPPPFDVAGEPRRNLAYELIGGIAQLANVDYQAVGLEGFGKPDFLKRQVDRWLGQLGVYRDTLNYQGRDIPGLAYVVDWLRANCPQTPRVGIIHGDYGFANAMFSHTAPAKLLAIIDWELSTIGDPLLDLGWAIYTFNTTDTRYPKVTYYDPSFYPSREELVEYYADRTKLPMDNLDYYIVLAQFKLAMLLERKYAESLIGRTPKGGGGYFEKFVLELIAAGEQIARLSRI